MTRNATMKPTIGDSTIGIRTLSLIAPQSTVAARRERCADESADQGVRRRRRQAEVPGGEVPGDRPQQARR